MAGLMTTGISLVRENTQSMQPPRSLWVSFPLGRPLGIPGDAGFQHQVISAALDLLSHSVGPVLEDFPLDAPAIELDDAPACPVSFANNAAAHETWGARLSADLATVMPWYDLSRRRRGRTLVGIAEVAGDLHHVVHGVGVVTVDVENRRVDHLGHGGAIKGRSQVVRAAGGETDLVVDHDVHSATDTEPAGL